MTFRYIRKGIGWGVFCSLIVLMLAVLSPVLPTKQFIRSYIVTSGSMSPTVPAGSLVFIHPAPGKPVQIGDIIAFTLPDSPKTTVLHRVSDVTTNPLTYHTKGDNNNAADRWSVPASSVMGTYLYSLPGVGYLAAFVRTKLGFGLMIGIPVLYLIYTQIRLIIDGIEEEIHKRADTTTILPLFIAGLLVGSITALGIRQIEARYVAQATIQGISISAGIVVIPVGPPTDMDQCKDDGWETFNNPTFKNQGDCVSFVQSNPNAEGNTK
jgi:signal peptidase I